MSNDPCINRKYNYLYKITNNANSKVYYGVHRTDNIDDGYMGSGTNIKRAINKYGISSFSKTILDFYDTYKEALDAEREIVNLSFIEENTNYNIREGGYGNCKWSSEARKLMSKKAKDRWLDDKHKSKMMKALKSKDRKLKISKGVIKWIENHPEEHQHRMDKINKNPAKIEKTAEYHRGKKRSDTGKLNIKRGILDSMDSDPQKKINRSGKGMIQIYNSDTEETKRYKKDVKIPNGWVRGSGPKRNKGNYKGINKDTFFGYCIETKKNKRFKISETIPDGYVKGKYIKSKRNG